jgi:predicted DsbA family dithiol-disulfide isomerase
MPVDGLPRDLYLRVKFGAGRSAAMAQTAIQVAGLEEGIEFDFERIERTPNTLNAHRLISFAQRHGCDNAVIDALFQGYFTKGLDVGDIDTLAVIADGCGLDEAVARQYLSHGSGTSEALAEEHRARRAGIHAVPCFIFDGGYAVAGAQDPAVFLPLLDLAAIVGGRIQAEA